MWIGTIYSQKTMLCYMQMLSIITQIRWFIKSLQRNNKILHRAKKNRGNESVIDSQLPTAISCRHPNKSSDKHTAEYNQRTRHIFSLPNSANTQWTNKSILITELLMIDF